MAGHMRGVGNQWRCPECDGTLRHTVHIRITLTPVEPPTYDMELEWSDRSSSSGQPSEPSEEGSLITLAEVGTQTDSPDVKQTAGSPDEYRGPMKEDQDPGPMLVTDSRPCTVCGAGSVINRKQSRAIYCAHQN